jgi:hypothetical protein
MLVKLLKDRATPVPTRADAAVAVLIAQSLFVAVLYSSTCDLYFMSDAWVILDQARHGLWKAVSTTVGYHYIPVTSAFTMASWRLFGTWAPGYQIVNLILHLLAGHLVYRVGWKLFRDVPVALFGSLLFLGNPSFHEVTLWPVVGAAHSLGATFCLLGLQVVLDMAETGEYSGRRWVFALWLLLGIFSYEGAITLLPLAGVALLLARFRGFGDQAPRPWRQVREWLWIVKALLPSLAASLLLLLAKVHFAVQTAKAVKLQFDAKRAYLLVRGLFAVFSLHASADTLQPFVTLGTNTLYGSSVALGLLGALAIGLVWRLQRRALLAPTLMLSWLIVYLGIASASIGISPRHTYMAAIPSALLTAAFFRSLGRRLAGRDDDLWSVAPVGLATLLLLLGSQTDLRTAYDLWRESSDINRQIVDAVRTELAPRGKAVTLLLVNMPGSIIRRGMGAYVVSNGLREMARIYFGETVSTLRFPYTYLNPGDLPNRSYPSTLSLLRGESTDFSKAILIYDRGQVLPLDGLRWPLSDHYTAESSPYLGWHFGGAWPLLMLHAGQSVDLPFRIPHPRPWLALRYLHGAETRFTLDSKDTRVADVQPSAAPPAWIVRTWPLPGAEPTRPVSVTVTTGAELWLAHAWVFAPPVRYDPDTSPFLWWTVRGKEACVWMPGETRLPLDLSGCTRCRVRLEYLADKGRELSLRVGTAPAQPLSTAVPPQWKTVSLPIAADGPFLTFRQEGTAVPSLHTIVVEDDGSVRRGGE